VFLAEVIGNAATVDAVLVRLLDHKDAKLARRVIETLKLRLPDPQLEGKLHKRNPFHNDLEDLRGWLVERGWRAEFAPAVKKAGRRLLAGPDEEDVRCGAFIVECLADQDDLPALVQALDRAAALARDMPPEENTYPRPRGACQELLRAARVMSQREVTPPPAPRSPGELILFATAIGARESFRPAGWETTYARVLQDDLPYVREVGLQELPLPPPKSLLGLLPGLLADKNIDVQIAACGVAEKVKAPELREPVLRVLALAREHWLLNAASNAAYVLDTRLGRVRVLVARLDEEGMAADCLGYLASSVLSDLSSHGRPTREMLDGAAGRACKAAWLRFLKEHWEELQAGKVFSLADPVVPVKELFPGFTFYPPKKSARPSRDSEKPGK